MKSRNKSKKRDRSMRHAFIYINLLKADLGLPFNEIVEILNDDNYRTRSGEQYTEKQVLNIYSQCSIIK